MKSVLIKCIIIFQSLHINLLIDIYLFNLHVVIIKSLLTASLAAY